MSRTISAIAPLAPQSPPSTSCSPHSRHVPMNFCAAALDWSCGSREMSLDDGGGIGTASRTVRRRSHPRQVDVGISIIQPAHSSHHGSHPNCSLTSTTGRGPAPSDQLRLERLPMPLEPPAPPQHPFNAEPLRGPQAEPRHACRPLAAEGVCL